MDSFSIWHYGLDAQGALGDIWPEVLHIGKLAPTILPVLTVLFRSGCETLTF